MTNVFKHFRPKLWDVGQRIFGADGEKQRLYFESLGPVSPNDRILDFGCATGNVSEPFKGHQYLGLDIDPALIEYALYKFRNNPEMKFVSADVLEFKPPHKFKHILFAGVAHHLDNTLLDKILTKLKSLLDRSGQICFIDPVLTGKESTLLKILLGLDQGKFHRSAEEYEKTFKRLSFNVNKSHPLNAADTLFPQPTYMFYSLN